AIAPPADPIREGHTFVGWYEDDGTFAIPYTFDTMPAYDTILYAKWDINIYEVQFETYDGSFTPVQYVTFNNVLEGLVSPLKDGYAFAGWYQDETFTTPFDIINPITSNLTLYAKWDLQEYFIIFDSMGGTSVDTIIADYGNPIEVSPETPVLTGHDFLGWFVDVALTEEFVFDENTTMPSHNTRLYAAWTKSTYTVSYDSNEGSLIEDQEVLFEDLVEEPQDPTQVGYTFAGWYEDDTLLIPYGFGTMPANDFTLYAKWDVNQYTITFVSNEGSQIDQLEEDYLENIVAPAEPVREGHEFVDWYEDDTLLIPYGFGTMPANDLTLYAKWTVNTYTITFETSPGTEIEPLTLDYGTEIPRPADPSRDPGYYFAGWYEDDTLLIPYTFDTMPADNVTIYAKYQPIVYTILFNTNSKDLLVSSINRIYQQEIGELQTPEVVDPLSDRYGYTFEGWFTDTLLTTEFNLTLMPADNFTLYAKWEIGTFNVFFESDGGSLVDPLTDEYGTGISEPPQPSKVGYDFAGWYEDNQTFLNPFVFDFISGEDRTAYAKWNLASFTITFETNGGTPVSDIQEDYLTVIDEPELPVKVGYDFAGWFTDPELTQLFVFETMPGTDMTLYVKWQLSEYSIDFNVEGGTPVNSITQEYMSQVLPPTPPMKYGYVFSGWYEDALLTTLYTFETMPLGGKTLYAKWSPGVFSIVFDSNFGTNVDPIVEVYDSPIEEPATLRSGFSFTGWYEDQDLTIPFVFDFMPGQSYVLFAGWTINQYTITFDNDGGSLTDPITQNFNTDVDVPLSPTKIGHTFAGWSPSVPGVMPAENLTLTAQWNVNQYTISFESNGGTFISAMTEDYATNVTEPDDPYYYGYEFDDWYIDSELTTPYEFTTMPADNLTLYAGWILGTYTITFDTNGGTPVAQIVQEYLTPIARPEDPNRLPGFAFEGWYAVNPLDPNNPGSRYMFNTMPGTDTTIYANWVQIDYSILFNTSSVHILVGSLTYHYGDEVANPLPEPRAALPSDDLYGYAFVDWYEDPALTQVYVPGTMPANNITLYARWEIGEYTLSFDSSGGSEVIAITAHYDDDISDPDSPTKEGYVFEGWYDDIALTERFVFDKMPGEDHMLYANWTLGTYTLSFDSVGGTAIVDVVQDFGTDLPLPFDEPTKTGYTFAGWYEDSAYVTAFNETQMYGFDHTLYAKWDINQYTISFDSDGGNEVGAISQDYDSVVAPPPDPIKTGYSFAGWNPIVPGVMPAENLILTAQWTINQYTITFDSDGGSVVPAIVQDFNSAIIAPPDPTKTGYTFAGWNSAVPGLMPAENLTLTAQWTINQYTITFDSDGGSVVPVIVQDFNSLIIAPADPIKIGYTFAGWSPIVPGTMPAEDLTLTALWDVNQYTISFESNGGDAVGAITQDYDTAVAQPVSPARIGYSFVDWFEDDTLLTPYVFDTMPASDITLYAKWNSVPVFVTQSPVDGTHHSYIENDTFIFTVTMMDSDLSYIELSFYLNGTRIFINGYANEINPYGSVQRQNSVNSLGISIAYDEALMTWGFEFSSDLIHDYFEEDNLLIHFIVYDEFGNTWGSPSSIPENTFEYTFEVNYAPVLTDITPEAHIDLPETGSLLFEVAYQDDDLEMIKVYNSVTQVITLYASTANPFGTDVNQTRMTDLGISSTYSYNSLSGVGTWTLDFGNTLSLEAGNQGELSLMYSVYDIAGNLIASDEYDYPITVNPAPTYESVTPSDDETVYFSATDTFELVVDVTDDDLTELIIFHNIPTLGFDLELIADEADPYDGMEASYALNGITVVYTEASQTWTVDFGLPLTIDMIANGGLELDIEVRDLTGSAVFEEKSYTFVGDSVDPVLEQLSPAGPNVVILEGESFIMEVDVLDDYMSHIVITHDITGIGFDLELYANSADPYNGEEATYQTLGMTVTYDDISQVWTIDFGVDLTVQMEIDALNTFDIFLADLSGNTTSDIGNDFFISIDIAPDLVGATEEGIYYLKSGVDFVFEITFSDDNLDALELTTSLVVMPAFTVYADNLDPYGSPANEASLTSQGIAVVYDELANQGTWTISFSGASLTEMINDGNVIIEAVVADDATNNVHAGPYSFGIVEDTTAPTFVSISYPSGPIELLDHETVQLIIHADDANLNSLLVDHDISGIAFDFMLFADETDPYGGLEASYAAEGITVTYDPISSTWTIDLGESATDQMALDLSNDVQYTLSDLAGNQSTSAVFTYQVSVNPAPEFDEVTPAEGIIDLIEDEAFILYVNAQDDNLEKVVVDHNVTGVAFDLTLYADEVDPYNGLELTYSSLGIEVTYDNLTQMWTIDFGLTLTGAMFMEGQTTFDFALHDESGNITHSEQYVYQVNINFAPDIDGVTPSDGSLVILEDETFVIEIDVVDDDLASLEVDHDISTIPFNFAFIADEIDPYDGDDVTYTSIGVSASYDSITQKWIVDFGVVLTEQMSQDGVTNITLTISDSSGNVTTFGPLVYEIDIDPKPVIESITPTSGSYELLENGIFTIAVDIYDNNPSHLRIVHDISSIPDEIVLYPSVADPYGGEEALFLNWGITATYSNTEYVWILTFDNDLAKVMESDSINSLTFYVHDVVGNVTSSAEYDYQISINLAPQLVGINPDTGSIVLPEDTAFELDIQVSDDNLDYMTVTHTISSIPDPFTLYPDEVDPYNGLEAQYLGWGMAVEFSAVASTWTIVFDANLANTMDGDGSTTFEIELVDETGNVFESEAYLYEVSVDSTPLFEEILPVSGNYTLLENIGFEITIDASDSNLDQLVIQHDVSDILYDFVFEANSLNPYGSNEALYTSLGILASYDEVDQIWNINLGSQLSEQMATDGTNDLTYVLYDTIGNETTSITYQYQIDINLAPVIVSVNPGEGLITLLAGEGFVFDIIVSDDDLSNLSVVMNVGFGFELILLANELNPYGNAETELFFDTHGMTASYLYNLGNHIGTWTIDMGISATESWLIDSFMQLRIVAGDAFGNQSTIEEFEYTFELA
ncbi:MAG: InlB B-repeat-containing protein, partial [Acholeplasmataceae bacterium]|nr:InlB B-repeat-containing protein [Acholeplasmataceae bacterium]